MIRYIYANGKVFVLRVKRKGFILFQKFKNQTKLLKLGDYKNIEEVKQKINNETI